MRLTLGPCSYDLTNRALVMGVGGAPDELVDQGADLVELDRPRGPSPVPVCVPAHDDAAVARALRTGASVVRLLAPTAAALKRCATAGVAVIVPAEWTHEASAAGVAHDLIVPDGVLLDVTGHDCPVAATVVGVLLGRRIVRTFDVRGARRVCDVLAAVLEAY